MAKTAAVRILEAARCDFQLCHYAYVERGGTRASSLALGVDEHCVVKTLIFEQSDSKPLIVLMHGDSQVSAKGLARQLGAKSVKPCTPQVAQKHSGYQVGGTSPFGTRKAMPIYMQRSIADLECIYINGGKRGLLLKLAPEVVVQVLGPTLVDVCA